MLLLLYAGCKNVADFPFPATATVEFHIDFVDLTFPYGTYEFAWVGTCQEGCAAEPPSVSCQATFDRFELQVNLQNHGGVVVLPAFPLADPAIHCLPPLTSEPQQGVWLYQLVVKGVPADEVVVDSSCAAMIFGGVNVIRHTELALGEASNACAPEVGGT